MAIQRTQTTHSVSPPGSVADFPLLAADPIEISERVFTTDRRVLLVGQPGIGKTTLVRRLAVTLASAGRACWCLGADPGSPPFGVPGAVCLGRWTEEGWVLEDIEPICTLDAGRFRLPLVFAVRRLVQGIPPGVLLIDGPGVVRGVAGAELLVGLAEAAEVEAVMVLAREGRSIPLAQELGLLAAEVFAVTAAPEARRPGKRVRARVRTELWEAYIEDAQEQTLDLNSLHIVGTPPPLEATGAWIGRQVALLDGELTIAMGEVTGIDASVLETKLSAAPDGATTLLVRDAIRLPDGHLATAARFAAEPLVYVPAPEMAPGAAPVAGGLRVVGRVGTMNVNLVNGVFGDPLLHVRLRHERRSLLFDLGEGTRLSARIAHQVSDVFVTHAHIDHIGGFLWLLRSRIGDYPVCRIYGPPGLAANIDGLVRGILWDRVEDRGPRFEVSELHGDCVKRFMVHAGRPGQKQIDEHPAPDGIILAEPSFRVRATTLSHVSPVLAFALEPAHQLNVRKDRLRERNLAPGRWLGELKRRVHAEQGDAPITLPDGKVEITQKLAAEFVLISPGKKLVYATDFADTPENRARLVALARGAHTFFCESTFLEEDHEQALRTAHITTRACGEIAEAAGVARLVPFHFSRRYEDAPERIYDELATFTSRLLTASPKNGDRPLF